jgi:hypothetical protein
MIRPDHSGSASGPLLLADISGYPGFLRETYEHYPPIF